MKKKLFYSGITAAVLAFSCMSGALSVSAYTADDVAAKARAAGWPEYLIQAGYNQWASGNYSQEKLDAAYNSVTAYSDDVGQTVGNILGVEVQPSGGDTSGSVPDDTPADTPVETQSAPSTTPAVSGKLENVTKADGTTEPRIPAADFIAMTLEQKQAYVDGLSEDSKKAFVASLSKEERNSMIKQMPVEDKAALVQKYIDMAGEMGVNVTVDSLSGGNISLTVRNEDGVVVDKAAVGVTIDETGISHTKPLAAAAGGTVLALLGFGGLYAYIRKTEKE